MKVEEFKEKYPVLARQVEFILSQEELDAMCRLKWNLDEKRKPRFSCKRGDIIRFWSEWTDFSKGLFLDRIERVGIALDDYTDTQDALCLEYSSKYKCWRTEPVRGDKFVEIIGHYDFSELEQLTEKLWKESGVYDD